jgi:DnaJ-domain-containing protein 1
MTSRFEYRPRFVDVRIRPPGAEAQARARGARGGRTRPEPESETRACDHVGCPGAGTCRAPKSRERLNEYWWFCEAHAADYNRRWDFFAGMTEAEFEAYQRAEFVGHRPTWNTRPGGDPRLGPGRRQDPREGAADPHGLFGEANDAARRAAEERRGRSGVTLRALEVLGLEHDADAAAIRQRYAELVKKFHPDSNGGERSAEDRLQRVIRAWQTLKAAGAA